MENLAKPIVRKFFLALLTIAALSGAVLVTHSSPAEARWVCNSICAGHCC
jgi:hypothetical protein